LIRLQTSRITVSNIIVGGESCAIDIAQVGLTSHEIVSRISKISVKLNTLGCVNVCLLAEQFEVDLEGEAVAGHDKIVGEKPTTSSNLSHISIGVPKQLG
jgi:Zn finger protein HypA/HybF involved in hydrogenase expression